MVIKFLIKAIGLGLLVGLIIYAIAKFIGLGGNSTMIAAVTAAVVTVLNPPKLFPSKSNQR